MKDDHERLELIDGRYDFDDPPRRRKKGERKARPGVVDHQLAAMNAQFAVVSLGGKTRVMGFQASPARPDALVPVYSTFPDFKAFHDKHRVDEKHEAGGTKRIGRGTWWLKHPERRQYAPVVFEPGARDCDDVFNLWRGFAVEPAEGDCSLYLAHLTDIVCCGNDEHAGYLLNWLAWAVQNPGIAPGVAVVLRGGEGTGKGIAVRFFGELFGPHFVHVSHAGHLVGNFNAHLQGCSVLFADETFFAGDRRHESVLKARITEPTLTLEQKGVDAYEVRNALHIVMSSNEQWVIPAGADARRFFVLDVSDVRKQDTTYFGAIADEMKAGGPAALLHFLLNRGLAGFNIRKVPQTEALADQKAHSRRGVDLLVEILATDGWLPCIDRAEHPHVVVTSGEHNEYGFYLAARRLPPTLRHMSSIVIKRREWGCRHWHSGSTNGIEFPPLADLRALFDRKFGPRTGPRLTRGKRRCRTRRNPDGLNQSVQPILVLFFKEISKLGLRLGWLLRIGWSDFEDARPRCRRPAARGPSRRSAKSSSILCIPTVRSSAN